MQLWEYEGKRVRITDVDGEVFIGLADIYHHADDNESGIASISLDPDGISDAYIGFDENEIASIEILASEIPDMAEAI